MLTQKASSLQNPENFAETGAPSSSVYTTANSSDALDCAFLRLCMEVPPSLAHRVDLMIEQVPNIPVSLVHASLGPVHIIERLDRFPTSATVDKLLAIA